MTFIKTKYAINESGYFVSDLTFYQNKQSDFEDIACTNSEKEQNKIEIKRFNKINKYFHQCRTPKFYKVYFKTKYKRVGDWK